MTRQRACLDRDTVPNSLIVHVVGVHDNAPIEIWTTALDQQCDCAHGSRGDLPPPVPGRRPLVPSYFERGSAAFASAWMPSMLKDVRAQRSARSYSKVAAKSGPGIQIW